MLERFWRRRRLDDGFTLVEIMITVLVIGLLIAIALPTFLGARQRARNRSVQANLRSGLAAAKVFYAERQTYVGFTAAVARTIEPSLTWAAAGNPPIGTVAIGGPAPTATQIQLVARSTFSYFCVKDVTTGATAGTRYGTGAAYANVDQATECTALTW